MQYAHPISEVGTGAGGAPCPFTVFGGRIINDALLTGKHRHHGFIIISGTHSRDPGSYEWDRVERRAVGDDGTCET